MLIPGGISYQAKCRDVSEVFQVIGTALIKPKIFSHSKKKKKSNHWAEEKDGSQNI
jgi:hypothetical protein